MIVSGELAELMRSLDNLRDAFWVALEQVETAAYEELLGGNRDEPCRRPSSWRPGGGPGACRRESRAAHPAKPLAIISACAPTAYIDNQQAAVVGSSSEPCMLPSCVLNGPGVIAKGSTRVFHCNLPAARADDMTSHAGCVAPIPSPVSKVIPPCSSTVDIGG